MLRPLCMYDEKPSLCIERAVWHSFPVNQPTWSTYYPYSQLFHQSHQRWLLTWGYASWCPCFFPSRLKFFHHFVNFSMKTPVSSGAWLFSKWRRYHIAHTVFSSNTFKHVETLCGSLGFGHTGTLVNAETFTRAEAYTARRSLSTFHVAILMVPPSSTLGIPVCSVSQRFHTFFNRWTKS